MSTDKVVKIPAVYKWEGEVEEVDLEISIPAGEYEPGDGSKITINCVDDGNRIFQLLVSIDHLEEVLDKAEAEDIREFDAKLDEVHKNSKDSGV